MKKKIILLVLPLLLCFVFNDKALASSFSLPNTQFNPLSAGTDTSTIIELGENESIYIDINNELGTNDNLLFQIMDDDDYTYYKHAECDFLSDYTLESRPYTLNSKIDYVNDEVYLNIINHGGEYIFEVNGACQVLCVNFI